MPVGGDLAADPAVIEWKGPEVLGDQDTDISPHRNRTPAKASFVHAGIQATGSTVQPRHELAVTHRVVVYPQVLDDTLHHLCRIT